MPATSRYALLALLAGAAACGNDQDPMAPDATAGRYRAPRQQPPFPPRPEC